MLDVALFLNSPPLLFSFTLKLYSNIKYFLCLNLNQKITYFSAETGLTEQIKTYSGGHLMDFVDNLIRALLDL